MNPADDEALLQDILTAARRAIDAVRDRQRADLDTDPVLAAALERFVEVIGEAASKLSTQTRERASQIPWREMIGMRNRLIHGYASVDHDILWDVVTDDLPKVVAEIERLVPR